ncbi:hypothetical protein [Arenimonas sp. MALMAid1274]|uniref:hypothetical protein n=1 Tax=Arenimonas sp. MALMAid1274 TaxID=3411630 RepID=UPI003B9FC19F
MRTLFVVCVTVALTACGGGGAGGSGNANEAAAEACKLAAESRLNGKLYTLDQPALAASMKDAPNGEKFLTAPIVIEPGLTSEVKQIVECTVRFDEGKETPDVVGFVFNW